MDETTVTHKCPDCGEMLPENFWHAHGSGPLEQSCAIESLKAKLREKELQVGELQKVVEGCKDTFEQFCGTAGAVIAHPPKCRFYVEGKQRDCSCSAKNTANDVMLSLKACREILAKTEKRKDQATETECRHIAQTCVCYTKD